MSDRAVEFIIKECKGHNLVHFKMVKDTIKKNDVINFLEDYLKMVTEFKEKDIKYYGLWQINIVSVLPPTYIKIIRDFMPKIRQLGAERTIGSSIVFKSGTIRSFMNKCIIEYKLDQGWLKFVKTPDLGIEYLREIGMKDT